MQNLAIIYHGGNGYRVNFVFMSKNDALNLIKNSNIIDKKGVLQCHLIQIKDLQKI